MPAPAAMPLLPGGHGALTYLFEDFQQGNASGIGTIDDTLGVLEAKAYHSWVNYRGGDAAGTKVRTVSSLWYSTAQERPMARPLPKQSKGCSKKRSVSPALLAL